MVPINNAKICMYCIIVMMIASTICFMMYGNSYEWIALEPSVESITLNKDYCSYSDAIKYGRWIDTSSNFSQNHYEILKKNNVQFISSDTLMDQYQCPATLDGKAEVSWNCSNRKMSRALSFEYYLHKNINNVCKLFHLFDAQKFLNLINNTNLYIIGDSQSWQHYLSLICILTSVNHSVEYVANSDNLECINFIEEYKKVNSAHPWIGYNEYNMICMKLIVSFNTTNTTIIMIRSNFLMTSLHRFNTSYFYEYWNMMLFKYITNDRKQIVMINNGAHWMTHRLPKLLDTIQYLPMLILNVSNNTADIIYRTTLHGHPYCQKYDKLYSDNFLIVLKQEGMPYNWHKLDNLDKIVIDAIKNKTHNRIHVWNVSDFFRAMSIGHVSERDCFHYCMPGPLYWWNVLLYHYFKQYIV